MFDNFFKQLNYVWMPRWSEATTQFGLALFPPLNYEAHIRALQRRSKYEQLTDREKLLLNPNVNARAKKQIYEACVKDEAWSYGALFQIILLLAILAVNTLVAIALKLLLALAAYVWTL